MTRFFIFIFSILSFHLSMAQANDITFYCDVMVNAFDAKHRIHAEEKFTSLFEQELSQPASFSKDFKDLKWVSIKRPADNSFRIITWQLKGINDVYAYKGVIQTKEGTLFRLDDHSQEMAGINFEVLNPDDWFGALYYNMIEGGEGADKYYILFGFNGWNEQTHKKVIEVLHFEKGIPKFGKNIFLTNDIKDGNHAQTRVIIEYDGNANVNCNYNEGMKMIVYDYVTTRAGFGPGEEHKKVPDGTYVAYEPKGSKWQKIDQLATKVQTNEDIFYKPKDKEEGGKKDIFGRPAKGKGR